VTGDGRDQQLIFRTNVDDTVAADGDHPLRVVNHAATGEPNPYVLVRDGLEARLSRPVFYELVERGIEERVGDANPFRCMEQRQILPVGPVGRQGLTADDVRRRFAKAIAGERASDPKTLTATRGDHSLVPGGAPPASALTRRPCSCRWSCSRPG